MWQRVHCVMKFVIRSYYYYRARQDDDAYQITEQVVKVI